MVSFLAATSVIANVTARSNVAKTSAAEIEAISDPSYLEAFRQLQLSESDIRMLRAHYLAPRRTITATQLAFAVGFGVYSASNLHYGRLARKLCRVLNLTPRHNLAAFVFFHRPNEEWEWEMRPQLAYAIETLSIVIATERYFSPDEIINESSLVEGGKYRVTVNGFERNDEARRRCLDYFGYQCQGCGMSFADRYGKDFSRIIHVHHLRPLATIRETYQIDPIADLVPICPNCHAVIHARANRSETYSIDDLKRFIQRNERP